MPGGAAAELAPPPPAPPPPPPSMGGSEKAGAVAERRTLSMAPWPRTAPAMLPSMAA